MSFLRSLNISSSALTAQRMRMDIIAENMANINTTRTASGEPYRRQYVLMQKREAEPFSAHLSNSLNQSLGRGVRVTKILEDPSPFKLDYNPGHPDADANGYVRMPNVEMVTEMVDMMEATRAYEANITALDAFKNIAMKALEIGR